MAYPEYISKELSLEIDQLKEKVEKLDLAKLINDHLIEDSNAHSSSIEDLYYNEKCIKPKSGQEKSTEFFKNLTNAWNWAKYKYTGKLNKEFVENIVRLIAPKEPEVQKGYRTCNVKITKASTLPPDKSKVYAMMEDLFKLVNNEYLHPVERAALTHFNIVKIHPFYDGNGRTARLLQNLILHRENYPPATIKHGERILYFSILDSAVHAHKLRTSNCSLNANQISFNERIFFDYVASKVDISLNEHLDIFCHLPEFKITIECTKDPNLIYAVKRKLESRFSYNKYIGKVRRDNKDKNGLVVTGEISQTNIENLINQLNEKFLDNTVIYHIKRCR